MAKVILLILLLMCIRECDRQQTLSHGSNMSCETLAIKAKVPLMSECYFSREERFYLNFHEALNMICLNPLYL